jgi:hypothetical protein
MRIIKFNESLSKLEIDDILVDLKDDGYEVESDVFGGFINITGRISEVDRIKFMKDVIDLNARMVAIGYESINDKIGLYMGKLNDQHYCKFTLKFKDNEVSANKNVNSFEEFKEYVEKVLDLNFYEWDTEVYIPDLEDNQDYQETSTLLKLDVNKEQQGSIPAGFTIGFEKGSLNDLRRRTAIPEQRRKKLSEIIMTDDEYYAVNLWAVPDREKSRYQDPELVKSAKSKQFQFDKRGIEAIEKCVNIFRSLR